MSLSGKFISCVHRLFETFQNILAPEDLRVRKLLEMPPFMMRDLLPRSPVYSKDILVLFDYQNKVVRSIVKLIKYKNSRSLRNWVAGYLYEELLDISSEIALFHGAPPLLLPMPMSKKEKRERGFNQTEELCLAIKKLGGENVELKTNILKKIRETKRQTKLGRKEREKNLKDSMAVPTESVGIVGGRVCIVLDDVYTTGASIKEASRALAASGAKRVIGLFIAH